MIAIRKNGTTGSPGMAPRPTSSAAVIARALGCAMSCPKMSPPRCMSSSSEDTRVTMIPAVVAMSSAGICETRPSPMVSSV